MAQREIQEVRAIQKICEDLFQEREAQHGSFLDNPDLDEYLSGTWLKNKRTARDIRNLIYKPLIEETRKKVERVKRALDNKEKVKEELDDFLKFLDSFGVNVDSLLDMRNYLDIVLAKTGMYKEHPNYKEEK